MGKQTHDSASGDAISALEALVARYDKDKVKKDQLKARIEQLTSILIKVNKSFEIVEPITSSLDEQVLKRAEEATSHSRVVVEWMDCMLSQGTRLIGSIVPLLTTLLMLWQK